MKDYELPDDRIEKDVVDYYASGVEDRRLQQGIGKLEFLRTKEITSRDLPPPPAVIYDVGGGPGMYSLWLAKKGYQVHLLDGNHFRPDIYPDFIPRSYFHLHGELRGEIEEAGFTFERMLAVEGPGWIVPDFDDMWSDNSRRERVLKIVRAVEDHPDIMGMSPHILAIACKGDLLFQS